jgi:hypothetical protein
MSACLPNPRDLPFRGDIDFMYVLRASDGSVKLGRTRAAQNRFLQHRQILRRTGVRITHFAIVQAGGHPSPTERELRVRFERIGQLRRGTKEWFYGVPWGVARNLLEQIAPRPFVYRIV